MEFIKENRNKMRISLLFLLWGFIVSLGVALTSNRNSITTSGVLPHNETWSGKVHITGDVVIPERVTLVI